MKHFFRLTALSLLAIGTGCASSSAEKPSLLVDVVQPELSASVEWNADTGAGQGDYPVGLRLASDGSRLYTADIKGRVVALDAVTGKRLWRTATGLRTSAGPSLIEDQLVIGTLDGEILSLSPETGAVEWRVELPGEILAPPAGDEGTIVVRTGDGRLFALGASDGSRRWAYDRNVPPLTLRGMSAPKVLAGGVVTGHDGGRVTVITLDAGNPVWEQVISTPTGRSELERLVDVDAELVIVDDWLYAASYGGDVVALDLASGAVRWRRAVKTHVGLAADAERVYVTASNGSVWCLDRFSGVRIWQQDALNYRKLSRPALFKGNVVVGDAEGYLHWLSPVDGSVVARRRVGSDPIRASMRVVQGQLLVLNQGGNVYAVDVVPTGKTSFVSGSKKAARHASPRKR